MPTNGLVGRRGAEIRLMGSLARVCFTAAVMVVVVWLLRSGMPIGAVAVVLLAVWLRRTAESPRADGTERTRLS